VVDYARREKVKPLIKVTWHHTKFDGSKRNCRNINKFKNLGEKRKGDGVGKKLVWSSIRTHVMSIREKSKKGLEDPLSNRKERGRHLKPNGLEERTKEKIGRAG